MVAAILVDDLAAPTRVLAARRVTPTELVGRWEFPGGRVEPGESPIDALLRELREELVVEVRLGPELVRPGGRPWPISAAYVLRLWFAVPLTVPSPTSSHDELRWLTQAELHDLDWLDTDREVVALLAPHLATQLDRS